MGRKCFRFIILCFLISDLVSPIFAASGHGPGSSAILIRYSREFLFICQHSHTSGLKQPRVDFTETFRSVMKTHMKGSGGDVSESLKRRGSRYPLLINTSPDCKIATEQNGPV